ncbi:NAD(P)/FAD-dependent oxidoreductase [Rhodohalobacter mucosus]|nr:FAD-dependent oxidoreductase [Rhodohalobacter mucosus]
MNRTFSFWEREEWLKKPDLLIVGAGIVGASLALFYKKAFPGHDVLIVEKGVAPEGASTRNAGFTCIGSLSEHLSDMQKAGEETVLKRIERRWNGLNLLRSTLAAGEMGYIHSGGYEIFTDNELLAECSGRLDEMNTLLHERLGIESVYSRREYMGYPAIHNHVEGAINSGKMMRTLHQKIQKAGVRIWWNTRVESIDSGVAHLDNDTGIQAEQIAVAVNGFAESLVGLPVKPARGYVFITKPIADLGWKGTFNHDRGYVYFRNVDNRLLLGGARNLAVEEETTDRFGINPVIKEYLLSFANDVIKLPPEWEIDVEWSGIMGITADKEPYINEIKPGVYAAAGLSGMGIAIGMQVAKELFELIRNSR